MRGVHFRDWPIARKIVVPYALLVVVVMGLSTGATLWLFGRYTLHSIDRSLQEQLETMQKTGFLNPENPADLNKVKEAFGVEVVGASSSGMIMGATLDFSRWTPEEIDRLQATLRSAYQSSPAGRTFRAAGITYRLLPMRVHTQHNVAVVALMRDLTAINAARYRIALAIAGVTGFGVLVMIRIGTWIARTITGPIQELVAVTQRITDGNLNEQPAHTQRDEIGQLAEAFRRMTVQLRRSRDELVQAERLATAGRMAATFAHEIRNPLSSVKMLLQMSLERSLDEKTRTYLQHSLEEIERLNSIVEEMLNFARPIQIRRVPCDLVGEIEAVLRLIEPNLKRHGITVYLETSTRPELPLDRESMKQVFLNLFLNAIQSQPNGGEIRVLVEESPESVRVRVQDAGPGFSEEALRELFRPFFTTKTRGSGLGLVTCQRILEQHGATIVAGNRPEGGAEVTLVFPKVDSTEENLS